MLNGTRNGLQKLLMKQEARVIFSNFLQSIYSCEVLNIWEDIQKYKQSFEQWNDEEKLSHIKKVDQQYLQTGAPDEINISGTKRSTFERLIASPQFTPSLNLFDELETEILRIMQMDAYLKFIENQQPQSNQEKDENHPLIEEQRQVEEKKTLLSFLCCYV